MTLIDSNILFDIATRDANWLAWSLAALDRCSMHGALLINDIVYAELSARYSDREEVDAFVSEAGLRVERVPRDALFLASKAFIAYRRAGGTRTGVLSDFFIGAHAAVLDAPLLTRDPKRYRTYFPTVRLILPD